MPYVLALPVWEPVGDQRFVSALTKLTLLKFEWEASRFVAEVKVKVESTLEQATKAQKGCRGITTLSLTSALDVWVVNDTPRPLYPRETDAVPIV